jgi:predicted PurR-regulated permease PerM
MEMLYVLSASTVLIITALVIAYLLYRALDLLERIAATLERIEARDREKGP